MEIKFVTFSNKKNCHEERFINSCYENDIIPIILGKNIKETKYSHFNKFKEIHKFLKNEYFFKDVNVKIFVAFLFHELKVLCPVYVLYTMYLFFCLPVLLSAFRTSLGFKLCSCIST